MVRRLLLAVAVTVVMPLALMLTPSAVTAATAATCTGGVAVSEFAFNPPSVPQGSSSPLTLVLQNCTSQTVQGSTVWNGAYIGQGCPAFDGVSTPYTIAPGGTYTLTNTYGNPGFEGCQPTAVQVHASVNVNGLGTVTTVSATLQFTAACPSGIAIDQFSFSPAAVPVGQVSTLTLVLQNCGTQTEQGSSVWSFKFTGPGGAQPSGCPVLDPVAFSYSMAPGATSTATLGLDDPIATCLATGIAATATVSANGVAAVATATANLVIIQPVTGGCHVTYAPNNYPGGFTANVTIANNGASAINGWTLTFAFPGDQKITNAWNATVTQAGANVTAANLSYNASIASGGTQSFGFQGTWTTSDATPASFSVNGMACT